MKAVTFGEIMLRLQPPEYTRFVQASSFEATYGGAEANVAVSLANFGIHSVYVTKLPDNELGQAAVNKLRSFGIDTSLISRGKGRMGIYFNEKGVSERPSKCLYDRKDSVISLAKLEDFDWKKIFDGCNWFHLTGVTPALSPSMARNSIEICKMAKEAGAFVSVDLNYRSKLWTKEQAKQTMEEIAKYTDLCISNEADARDVFGISAKDSDVENGVLSLEGYESVARQMCSKYGFKKVAFTLRKSINASHNKWSGLLYDGENFYTSREYDMVIYDRLGGGDSFAAGLIFALMQNWDSQQCVDFAAASGCLKHTIRGDFNMVTKEEVLSLVKNGGSGRIIR